MTIIKRMRSWVRGPTEDAAWARPALLGLVGITAVLYTWSLNASGYGNEYYAAAAYSGSQSWTAWLFGSFDSASFISVDKPPVSLWVTGLSVRLFGLSYWSVLLPQAFAGVATVVVLHHTVRRWKGDVVAILAATAFAITPVVLVMFRYNNPDAVLTLLLVSVVAVTYSAVERDSGWRLAGAGALVGLAFLTKTTQALLVVPGIAVAYLYGATVGYRRKIVHGIAAAGAAIAASGWWVILAVTSSAAPYAGQTASGSFVDYVLGVNGLDRLGTEGGGGGPGGLDPFGGSGGWGRLFNTEVGGQISWLIPLAVLGLVIAAIRWPRSRTERTGWILWGTIFVTHFVVFSLMSGVFHPYYSMTIAPAIAVLAAAGAVEGYAAWTERSAGWWLLPVGVVATASWGVALLSRTTEFVSWLRTAIAVGAVAFGALMVGWWVVRTIDVRWRVAAGVLALFVSLAGPTAYALTSIGVDFSGGDPTAGPIEVRPLTDGVDQRMIGGENAGAFVAPPNGPNLPGRPPGEFRPGDPPAAGGVSPEQGPGVDREQVSVAPAVVEYLTDGYAGETWAVATIGSRTAARIILETGLPVMAMGGFSGGDPTPSAAELAGYIGDGDLRFVLLDQSQRAQPGWTDVVERLCAPVDLAGQGGALYDCAAG